MPKQLYALVKWIGGADDKTYTTGIPVDWIIGFDHDAYLRDHHDFSESYVVQWRDKKKQPKGGWECYDCHVVFVSDRLTQLNKHLQMIDGVKSPKVVELQNATESQHHIIPEKQILLHDKPVTTPFNSRDEDPVSKKRRKQLHFDSDEEISAENQVQPSRCVAKNNATSKIYPSTSGNILSTTEGEVVRERAVNVADNSAKEEPTLAELMAEIRKNTASIKSLREELDKLKQNDPDHIATRRPKYGSISAASCKNVSDLNDGEWFEGNVEIGRPGSGIFVSDLQWTAAISKGTYKAMATTLVTAVFPVDVLLKSNYKGGASKVKNSEGSRPKYEALDPKILRAIMYSVQKVYPKTFTEVGVGQAINMKLNNIRSKKTNGSSNTTSDTD